MKQRIIYAYLGAIIVLLLCFPVAAVFTMGGHSLMYITVFGLPVGLTLGTTYSDIRRDYEYSPMLLRALAVFLLSIAITFLVAEIRFSAFMINNGWLILPFMSPLMTALLTEPILRSRRT